LPNLRVIGFLIYIAEGYFKQRIRLRNKMQDIRLACISKGCISFLDKVNKPKAGKDYNHIGCYKNSI
jgi:hypothetical protein